MLVLRPGALGDTLLAVPALRALRRSGATLTLAAHAPAARLLASLGEVDRGLAFDDPSLGWLFSEGSVPEEPTVAWLNLEAVTIAKHLAVVAPSRPLHDEHCAKYLLGTLAPLGIDLRWDDSALRLTPIGSHEILVHPGSGSPSKNWPATKFAQVIRQLEAPVRLIVGEADRAVAAGVEAELGHAVPRLDTPTLEELAARLAGCLAYLGNDSGVSHLAGLCGARTVVLFGPTNPEVWRPLGPGVRVSGFDSSPHEVAEALVS